MLVSVLVWLIFSRHMVIGQNVLITLLKDGCFTKSSSAIAPIYNLTNWKEPMSLQNGKSVNCNKNLVRGLLLFRLSKVSKKQYSL